MPIPLQSCRDSPATPKILLATATKESLRRLNTRRNMLQHHAFIIFRSGAGGPVQPARPMSCNNVSGNHDNIFGKGAKVSGKADNFSGRYANVSGNAANVSGRCAKVSGNADTPIYLHEFQEFIVKKGRSVRTHPDKVDAKI